MDFETKLINKIGINVRKQKIRINDFVLNYITAGKGTPLLLIHGANIGWGQWYRNFPTLSKNFKIYAVDLPGSGESTVIDYKKSEFKKDYINTLSKFIQKLKLKNVIIVGHSTGGSVAFQLALENKSVKKIILVNPIGFTDKVANNQKLLSFRFIANLLSKTVMKPTRSNIKKFLQSVAHDKNAIKDEFVNYYLAVINRSPLNHPFIFFHGFMNNFKVKKDLLLSDLTKLRIPVLIIIGEKDPMIPITYKELHKIISQIPTWKLIRIKNTGHIPFLEKSRLFNKLIIDF